MNVGTTLFTELDSSKQCWTRDQVAILSSRRSFQNLLPHENDIDITNEEYIQHMFDYFLLVLENVRNTSRGETKNVLLIALSDTLGGYMNHFLLPVTRFSYYCGFISYDSVHQLYKLFNELKSFLKTTGYGWRPPGHFPIYNNTKIPDYEIPKPSKNPCDKILFYKNVSEMVIPLPYFDSKENPVSLAVPLKTSPVRNLESKNGAMLLAKYYNIAIQCLESKGNESLMALRAFKENFKTFLQKEVLPKLCDDKFYSVFGGVYRIFKDLKVPFIKKPCEQTVSGIGVDPNQVSDNLKKLMPNKYGFILIVIGLAALIWLCIGLVYCLICMRSLKKKKKSKKNDVKKEYMRISSNNDPYGPKSGDGNNSERSAKSDICFKKSINKIRKIFTSPTVDKDAPTYGKKKITKFSNKSHKKGCIQSFNQNSKKLMTSKSSIDTKEKCKPIFNESDSCSSSTISSKCTQSTKSAISREILDTYVCQKTTNDLKSVSFSASSPELICYSENFGCTCASKDTTTGVCLNTKNYGTCNRAISEESSTLSAHPSKNESRAELSKSKYPFKYNFKYDLENTSSSESSPGDQLWPYPVTNSSNTSRIQEKHKYSIPKRNN